MKIDSFDILSAISECDWQKVYKCFCDHFDICAAESLYLDIYPKNEKAKYVVLWQDGLVYSWRASTGWQSPDKSEFDRNEMLIKP